MEIGQKVKLLADNSQLYAGEFAYITKIYLEEGCVDLIDKPLDYFPQDDCVHDRSAHKVPISEIQLQ